MSVEDLIKCTKPMIKWVGGKTQIIGSLINNFPTKINNYYEPFVGGGSVLFALLSHVRENKILITGNIMASDTNEALIYMYKNIQTTPQLVYDHIQRLKLEYDAINQLKHHQSVNVDADADVNAKKRKKITQISEDDARLSQENYYYWIRQKYNHPEFDKKTPEASATFIFLNKTCFRGVFREGPNGFNVPFGHYKNPEMVDYNHLYEVHNLLQGCRIQFTCCDFTDCLKRAISTTRTADDFVFLDPPYAPETKTSFVGYVNDGFSLERHQCLFDWIDKLTNKDVKIMMTNHDVSLVRDRFSGSGSSEYNIQTIECRRTINSKKPESKTMEIIVKNYKEQ